MGKLLLIMWDFTHNKRGRKQSVMFLVTSNADLYLTYQGSKEKK